jgi:hypothetical protein
MNEASAKDDARRLSREYRHQFWRLYRLPHGTVWIRGDVVSPEIIDGIKVVHIATFVDGAQIHP